MRAFIEAAGGDIDIPETAKLAPELYLGRPISELATELGRLCSVRNIFTLGADEIVTVDGQGRRKGMNPNRFVSWIEEFVSPFAFDKHGNKTVKSMGKEVAANVLKSDVFLGFLRPLLGVNPVRLPVLRSGGGAFLLPEGYDEESQTFTVDGLGYDQDWTMDDVLDWLREFYSEFPWADQEQGLGARRSAAVQLAAMLSVYCRLFFKGGKPMVLYLANQRGSGKSLLALMALAPVFGSVFSDDLPPTKEELKKVLDAKAQALAPYLWFDDLEKWFFSTALNRFITAPGHSGRVLGSKDTFEVPNVTQVFATGNFVNTSADLQRRAVFVELFVAGEVQGRQFGQTITEDWVQGAEYRSKALAAMWAIVRNWSEQGCPDGPTELASFSHWSKAIGGMVTAMGWADPVEPPVLESGGDEEGVQFLELLRRLGHDVLVQTQAEAAEQGKGWAQGEAIFKRVDLVEKAREWDLLEHLVGTKGDVDLKASDSRKFGSRLKEYRGREIVFVAEEGQDAGDSFRAVFGKRHSRSGSIYPCTVTYADVG